MAERSITLGRSIAQNWQTEALLAALAGMEICWFAPLFLAVTRSTWDYAPFLVALILWLLVWAMMRLALFLAERQIGAPAYELIVAGAVLLSALLVIRLYVYSDLPGYDVTWIASTARALTTFAGGLSDELIVLVTMLFLWWRAISLSQTEHTFHTVGYEFRRNVLLLIVSTLVLSFFVGREVRVFVAPFFFFCLLAVALARVRDKSQVSGGVERPFGPSWLLILSLCSAVVLGLAWLLSSLYSVEGWRALLQWLDPLLVWLARAVSWVLVKLLELLGPLLEMLVTVLRRWLSSANFGQGTEPQVNDFLSQLQAGATGQSAPPPWLTVIVRYLCPGLGIAAALLLIVLWLERRRRWTGRVMSDDRESVWGESTSTRREQGFLQRAFGRLRGLADQIAQFGVGRRLYAAISVRYIYANVVRLAERRGYPRAQAQTPHEFLPALVQAFPGRASDLQAITEAYVRVHYGEVPSTMQEIESLRARWNRVREARAPTLSDGAEEMSSQEGGDVS